MSCVLACSAQAHLGRYKSLITRAEECSKGLGCAPLTHTTVPSTKNALGEKKVEAETRTWPVAAIVKQQRSWAMVAFRA